MAFQHEPVLLQEVLQWMNVRRDGIYCDGTLGGGGHSEAILKASGGTASLYGIDRDETAITAASDRLRQYPGFHAIRGNRSTIKQVLIYCTGHYVYYCGAYNCYFLIHTSPYPRSFLSVLQELNRTPRASMQTMLKPVSHPDKFR